jgi:hypothetical protein
MWTIRGRHTGALRLADRMRRHGVNVQPIVHPAVDDNAARHGSSSTPRTRRNSSVPPWSMCAPR